VYMGRKTAKIDESVLDRVREHVKKTGQTVSGFMNVTLTEKLNELHGGKTTKKKYFASMGEFLTQSSNKKKK
jgi:hypothetical protein